MEIMLYVLGVIGLTHILVDSKVMQPIRDWFNEPYWPPMGKCLKTLFIHPLVWLLDYFVKPIGQIIGCYQCCGFWAGLVTAWLVITNATFCQILAGGFAGSFLANAAAIYMNYLEAQTIVRLQEDHKDG
jgi:hypothetical protein